MPHFVLIIIYSMALLFIKVGFFLCLGSLRPPVYASGHIDRVCVCVFCRGDGRLGREGRQHPNLIQTHSSPEGIKGEWGMGGPFPRVERLHFL